MSRHRNIRNLTADDYDYDDDYYDDDDYYEEDDDDYYQQQQEEKKKREKEEAERRAEAALAVTATTATSAAAKKGAANTSKQTAKSSSISPAEKSERERLVSRMGFTPSRSRTALEKSGYDVQRAIDDLLKGGGGGGGGMGGPPPPNPPPGLAAKTGGTKSGNNKASRAKARDTPTEEERKRLMAAFDSAPPPRIGSGGGKAGGSGGKAGGGGGAKAGGGSVASVSIGSGGKGGGGAKKQAAAAAAAAPTPPTVPKKKDGPQAVGVASQQPQQPPPPKVSAELMDSLKKQRSRLAMVVLGHVDAGKSTLMGQVLLKLGHVEKRTVTKYQKQAAELGKASFALAWVMDEDDSERERGVTMEIGTKFATTPNHDLTILDAPGHADFVPAMITGAASADVGLLVVAATTGEFEAGFEPGAAGGDEYNNKKGAAQGGQTREHIVLARGLGVSQLIVAVNKLDAADPPWSRDRFEHIKGRVLPFLQSNGFNPKRVRFVPISGLTGVNVKDGPGDGAAGLREWYNGPTLLEAIDGFTPAQRNIEKPLRLIVSDVFSEGKGVTARGRVAQGILTAGDRVTVLPIGDEAAVSRIEHGKAVSAASPYSYAPNSPSSPSSEDAERMKVAVAGDSVDVVLTGIDIARTGPGCVLSHTHLQLRPPVKKRFRAKLLVMDQLNVPIIRGAQVLLHMHSIDVPAVVNKLISTNKKDGTVKERPRVLGGGANSTVEITTKERICIETFSDCRSLGRFVLRRGGDTIAVGIIEEILG